MNDTAPEAASGAAPAAAPPRLAPPVINTVTIADLRAALKAGLSDFSKTPLMGLFFGAFYAAGGAFMVAAAAVMDMGWVVYPLMAGFALIGPFTAVGLYEISRTLERGEQPTWGAVLKVIWAQRKREIAWMGFAMLFILIMWMYQVRMLLALFLGLEAFHGFDGLVRVIFTTPTGLAFLAIGHAWGAIIALIVFTLTVVSIPLLLDREHDFVTAMVASVKTVKQSTPVMLGWGFFVVVTLFLSILPGFLGLIVTLPVLGHATWHIYKRAVAPA
ncbi:MAG: DUF2189 domain-containing protein [Pseudomonadota bacterium]